MQLRRIDVPVLKKINVFRRPLKVGMHRIVFLPEIRPAGYPANSKAGYRISGASLIKSNFSVCVVGGGTATDQHHGATSGTQAKIVVRGRIFSNRPDTNRVSELKF
jgi:hypothetical protein